MFALCLASSASAYAQNLPSVSIGNAEADESDASIEFVVRLSGSASVAASVAYATSHRSATAGDDYIHAEGTLTFVAGETRKTISVTLLDDASYEPDETLDVTLSGASGATLNDATGRGTIRDDDALPLLRIDGSRVAENEVLRFTITLTPASGVRASVRWFVEHDRLSNIGSARQARPGVDHSSPAGTVTFEPGETSKTVRVGVIDDSVDEWEEFVVVSLTDPVNAQFAERAGTQACPYAYCTSERDECCACGFIVDNDLAELSIRDASGPEDAAHLSFRVALNERTYEPVTATYATSDGTAVATEDYQAASGTLTIPVGSVRETIEVTPLDDDQLEHPETFEVRLLSVVGATPGDAVGIGTITDNDAPVVSVADSSGVEGETVEFTVTLSDAVSESVTISYATSDGSADAGDDYHPTEGNLTISAGETSGTVSVQLADDAADEPNETFNLALLSAEIGRLGAATAVGIIIDNDDTPRITISDAETVEGRSAAFKVTIHALSNRTVNMHFRTVAGTATMDSDYRHRWGTLRFLPGTLARELSVASLHDQSHEPDETFTLELSRATNAQFDRSAATGTIRDDDDLPALTVAPATGIEGDVADFEIRLSVVSGFEVTVEYETGNGTASAGEDYEAATGTVTLAPGEASRTVSVSLADDAVHEPEETFSIALSSPVSATIGNASAVGTIIDDDDPPAFSVADGAGVEGGSAEFSVTLAGSSSRTATVSYATSDGTATAGADYETVAGTLTFAPGESTRTLSVVLVDDVVDEPTETFAVTLGSASNATIDSATAQGTISDNDGPAQLSITGAQGNEGDVLNFAVTRTGSSDRAVTVSYATVDGSAVAGEDYEGVSGTLTFAGGESALTVRVSILDDATYEPEETFSLELSSPTHATLAVGAATGRIIDDDQPHKTPTKGRALLFESTTRAGRQGFVRIINHSTVAGELLVEGFDDSGMRVGPLSLTIGAGAARHFNSDDFESGNADKGIPVGVGPPSVGAWRLAFSSGLDLEVLSYARTADGFVTSLHDTAPVTAGVHRAVFLNPGGNVDQVSRLRLINPGAEYARVTIAGTDDAGGMSEEVVVELPPGTAREWTAAALESGVDADGALGDGDGKWQLRISADRPVVAMSLIESPTHNLTNLSTLPRVPGRAPGSRAVPLFLSASDTKGRQGFVRVANRAGEALAVRIEAFDRTNRAYEPLTLAVGVGEAAAFNSDDLELGNPDKGLTGSTGAGDGDWWLELSGDDHGDIEVWSYVRTADGFLTSMHDLVPDEAGAYRVAFFNPAQNVNQVSVLWLVNPGDDDAQVTITGVDDSADSPGTAVRTTVPAGSSLRLSSADLESGDAEAVDSGALGDGEGKWRLRVESDRPIRVMSLLENPTGHLTNLSSAPDRSLNDAFPDTLELPPANPAGVIIDDGKATGTMRHNESEPYVGALPTGDCGVPVDEDEWATEAAAQTHTIPLRERRSR